MSYRVGVDIGGTFTDLFAYDAKTGKSTSFSSPSTPANYADGVLNVIDKAGLKYEDIEVIVHGTTVATNAIIQSNYEEVAFVTTKGMRDLVEIGRFHREKLYDPYQQKSKPIVGRNNRYTIDERIDKSGNELVPVNIEEVKQVAEAIKEKGIKSVAVGFLNSYANNGHENQVVEILKNQLPDAYVVASTNIIKSIGALGRFSTGIINASLYHLVSNYIENLDSRLRERGFKGTLLLVQSNGGTITADLVRFKPETLLTSGPAGGVVGALAIGKTSGSEDIITFDMGGTSTDISIVEKGKPNMCSDYEIDWDVPVPIPMIEIVAIGAGGGSIAWIDSGGSLRVGPKSAGANPGPVCYGLGGTEPTVSDANLVLGYLDADAFLGGDMKLDIESAKASIEKLGKKLGLSMYQTAEGILEIVSENMSNAVKEVTVGKGRDPRDFAISAFGGAGSLHAVAVSEKVGVPTVIVPPDPGNLCAFGDINMNLQNEIEKFFYSKLAEVDIKELNKKFSEMDREGVEMLKSQKAKYDKTVIKHMVSMRYVGQSYELEIPCEDKIIDRDTIEKLAANFHEEHEKIYYVCDLNGELEITKLRTTVIGESIKDINLKGKNGPTGDAKPTTKDVYIGKEFVEAKIYQRKDIKHTDRILGPAIIREAKASTLIPPGKICTIDANNLSMIIKNAK